MNEYDKTHPEDTGSLLECRLVRSALAMSDGEECMFSTFLYDTWIVWSSIAVSRISTNAVESEEIKDALA